MKRAWVALVVVGVVGCKDKAKDAPTSGAGGPAAAVVEREGARHVFVVREGRAERRAVAVARTAGEEAEIEAGVSEGERVVVRPPAELKDGDRVRGEGDDGSTRRTE